MFKCYYFYSFTGYDISGETMKMNRVDSGVIKLSRNPKKAMLELIKSEGLSSGKLDQFHKI